MSAQSTRDTKGRNTPAQTLDIWNFWGDLDEFRNKSAWCVQLCWKLLEPPERCLVRFTLQSLRVLVAGGLDAIGYSDWLSARCSATILIGGVLANSAVCGRGRSDDGKQITFSILRRLRIITSPRADDATISSAIMIFQVTPSIVFHKRLLRSNIYWANTVCALFFYDKLRSAIHSFFSFFHVLDDLHKTSTTRC